MYEVEDLLHTEGMKSHKIKEAFGKRKEDVQGRLFSFVESPGGVILTITFLFDRYNLLYVLAGSQAPSPTYCVRISIFTKFTGHSPEIHIKVWESLLQVTDL